MYSIVNTILSTLNTIRISVSDKLKLENIINTQATLESKNGLTPEENLAIEILMRKNEKILIEHIRTMVDKENAK